jgi:hypothetical protein
MQIILEQLVFGLALVQLEGVCSTVIGVSRITGLPSSPLN